LTAVLAVWVGSLIGCGASLDEQLGAGLAGDEPASTGEPAADAKQLKVAGDAFISKSTPGNSAYKIGPLDVLEVSVFKVKDLSSSVQVAESGTINLPLVGEVPAAGRTAQEVERDLVARLGAKYLKSPQVTVYIKEYNSQRLTVEGAVKKPGVYPLKGKTTLLQCIAMAEGQDQTTASSSVIVFRRTEGKRSVARFDVEEIRAGRAEDPFMQQGDVIVVDTSTGKVAFNNVVKVIPLANLFRPF
jgi:polysaccharide export outer membrane protein